MFIHFLCLCPLRLAIMLNFNISKVAYFALLIHFREELKNDKRLLQIGFPPPLRFDFSRRLWRLFHKTQSCNDKRNSFNTNKIDVPYQICFWSKSNIICCEVLPSIKWR